MGHPVALQHNPADHMLFVIQTQTKEELATFCQSWAEEEKTVILSQIADVRSRPATLPPTALRGKSCILQLSLLVQRELREVMRNKIGLIMRFAVNGVLGLLFAFIFQGIGGKDNEPGGFQGHFGAVCNMMIGTMFSSSQPLLLQFPLERPVFLREYGSNMYGVIPYFLAKTVVEIPLSFLTALESWLIAYWVMDLSGNFMYLVLIGTALSLAAASTALFIGCSVSNAQSAQELAPLIFVPQIMFAGIFIPIGLVPVWLRWLQYICALKYAINLGCVVEFDYSPVFKAELKQTQNIDPDQAWLYALILACIFVGFRFLAMLNLRRKAQFVF